MWTWRSRTLEEKAGSLSEPRPTTNITNRSVFPPPAPPSVWRETFQEKTIFLTVAFLCDFGHSVVIHTNFESLGIVLLLCLCMMGPDRYNIHVHYVKLTCTLCDDSISWYRPWVLLHMWLLLRPHSADVLGTIVLHTLSRYGNGD